MTRILVFGKSGQLATALQGASTGTDFELEFTSSFEFNLIEHISDIYNYISNYKPIDAVINASAYTNVDKAEMCGAEDAWVLNALAPEQMAKACEARGIPFFHVSTDSVFSGKKTGAYRPNDPLDPVNFYGVTKLEGERLIQQTGCTGTIFRTSWVFSKTGHNFVNAMVTLADKHRQIKVVSDQLGLPVYALDLAQALLQAAGKIIANPAQKFDPVYHIVGGGQAINKYEFAKLIMRTASLETKVAPISSAQFAAPAPRPKNAVLDTRSFTATFKAELPDWRAGLKHMLSKTENK
ncbi:MAG: dTDP-4-dehydrorhamnose reductase [Robiginitomaculum sp.]|nr:dTDP-4-dehydrorhamnose reductase [Robiginitomaculum sp.]